MDKVASYYVGFFLKIFSPLLLLPVIIGKIYGESFTQLEPFIISSFVSIVLGYLLGMVGKRERPDAIQGMLAATVGWVLAVFIGGLPFKIMLEWSFVNAFFESMSGFSTTGMSIVQNISALPTSLVFWRAFIQWIGGLGILTFFVTVVVKAGGAATSLLSAESNKTSGGSIRPSLFNSIKSLWYVYVAFTVIELLALKLAGMNWLNSALYSFTTMPTGGFANTAGGVSAFSPTIQGILAVFMLAGGTNFLLLYRLLKGNISSFFKDFEFKLYISIMAIAALIIGSDLVLNNGMGIFGSLKTAVFQTISVTSSTGFELQPMSSFSEVSRLVFFLLMFVGGSLGSTTGGVKMFRLGIMFKIVAREIRSFTLPRNAINYITSNGKKLADNDLVRIVAIFFLWIALIVVGGIVTLYMTDLSIINAMQGMTSSIGTMGPLFISKAELIALPSVVKIFWALGMLAGRLELLPILVLLNVEIFKRFD
ncbi:MAG: potassium transporter TrkG [Candidatus Nanohaloarchaea archaeon]|nr:potassium transporter TrkG [Candidatus Nanohaloarchaea archaeon]